MEQTVARLGDSLSRASAIQAVSLPEIAYRGHVLPSGFVWFCLTFTNHRGWPHKPAWSGLFSPLGTLSDLHCDNDRRRANGAWPENLVSFFGTDDGVYCFQYGSESPPNVVYFDDWANLNAETAEECSTFDAATFEDWLGEMVGFLQEK